MASERTEWRKNNHENGTQTQTRIQQRKNKLLIHFQSKAKKKKKKSSDMSTHIQSDNRAHGTK